MGEDAPEPAQRRHTEPLQLRERAPRAPLGKKGAEADDGDEAVGRGDAGEVGGRGQLAEGVAAAAGGPGGRGKRRHEAAAAADGRQRGFRRSPEVDEGSSVEGGAVSRVGF